MARPASKKIPNRDFIRVGKSRIEGSGVFAKRLIPRGTRIVEYLGRRMPITTLLIESSDDSAPRRYVFRLNETMVIDGERSGNEARFINHSCEPNCEAYVFDDRLYIYAQRDIVRHEELTFDYKLGPAIPAQTRKRIAEKFRCRCGSPRCRGTMLADAPRSNKK